MWNKKCLVFSWDWMRSMHIIIFLDGPVLARTSEALETRRAYQMAGTCSMTRQRQASTLQCSAQGGIIQVWLLCMHTGNT